MSPEPLVIIQPRTAPAVTIPVEIASTEAEIKKGLSDRASLAASAGMLFLFDHSARFKFWMLGMRFPIDIIWIDESPTVVEISENIQPPSLFRKMLRRMPPFHSPSVPVRYVLEVNVHFCRTWNIAAGDAVRFNSVPLKSIRSESLPV
jgi:uncharacterized membrane protein (UPF0127 family)